MKLTTMSNTAILEEIGHRIQRERLNQNMSQAELASKAGVSRRAYQNLESGHTCTLSLLIRALRALNKIEMFDAFLPDPGPSPIQLAKLKGKTRLRSSRHRRDTTKG